jgi:hypothetical protein
LEQEKKQGRSLIKRDNTNTSFIALQQRQYGSFDLAEVQAETIEEAIDKATTVVYSLKKCNDVPCADFALGFQVSIALDSN